MTLSIVGISEMRKCGLKYVMHTPGSHKKSGAEAPQRLWEMNRVF